MDQFTVNLNISNMMQIANFSYWLNCFFIMFSRQEPMQFINSFTLWTFPLKQIIKQGVAHLQVESIQTLVNQQKVTWIFKVLSCCDLRTWILNDTQSLPVWSNPHFFGFDFPQDFSLQLVLGNVNLQNKQILFWLMVLLLRCHRTTPDVQPASSNTCTTQTNTLMPQLVKDY